MSIQQIKQYYIQERLNQIDKDFLEFEENTISQSDADKILKLLDKKITNIPNPHNSIILYVSGLTNDFDHNRRRSDLTGGSSPDIDMDFDALERNRAFEWAINHFGRDHVANIMTHGTFKPKSTVNDYFRVISTPETEQANKKLANEILAMIPEPLFGKEPTLDEAINGNPKKGYPAHPELLNSKYADWLQAARKLEDMVKTYSIHAAGIVISNDPIYEHIPIWWKDHQELQSNGDKKRIEKWITQFSMGEIEELGLLKFDFLSIDNISVIKEACKLIKENHSQTIDPYEIPDGDEKTYKLLEAGYVSGVFQLEGSNSVKQLTQRIAPKSIDELSDINALHRPGPLTAGLHEQYIANKQAGYSTSNMPEKVQELLQDTYWTLIYQEQVMSIVNKLAGFSLKEADDVRRAMGRDLTFPSPL